MGVTGLWKLIESSGKPVPLESLEGKVLAIDISIWLHQVVKGYQDGKGSHIQNAHILGLFNRICKLLYFRIKPIFVFDGNAPQLKMQTIAKRAQSKLKIQSETERLEQLLLETIAKEKVVIQAMGFPEKLLSPLKAPKSKPTVDDRDDLFKLPLIEEDCEKIKSIVSAGNEADDILCPKQAYDFNIHKIDITSSHFRSLPADMRHEILTDLKDTRKQNSWGRIRELPVDGNNFSEYQMKRLLKRRQVQVSMEDAEKEMGGKSWSLSELENLLSEDGILKVDENCGQKIASNENARFILVRDIANAMDEAKHRQRNENQPEPTTSRQNPHNESNDDEDLELQRAIQLSLAGELDDQNVNDIESANRANLNRLQKKKFSSTIQPHGLVRGFMMEYADMNTEDINELVDSTQVEDIDMESKFPLIDDYVINGTQREEAFETIEDNSGDVNELTNTSDQLNATQVEIVVKQSLENFNYEDDIFADIFKAKGTDSESVRHVPDIEVASISSDDTETYEVPSQEKLIVNEFELVSEEDENFEKQFNANGSKLIESEKLQSVEKTEEENIRNIKETNHKNTRCEEVHSETMISKCPKSHGVVEKLAHKIQVESKFPENALEAELQPCSSKSLNIFNNQIRDTPEKLEEMHTKLKLQQDTLNRERNKLERIGTSITKSMTQDCKELLRLFGIPYVEAIQEAEAQCAYLNLVDLTDGTITDDSDILLFGGKTIYKNFFVQKKIVMEFKQESIEDKFHLDRKKMIQLAMLVGSDYTLGVNGIGAVTALEILAAFPSTPEESQSTDQNQSLVSSLRKFREWMNGKQVGKTALRSKLRNIELSENFPNVQVARAYMTPTVDSSTENFSWGNLEKESLVDYAKCKLGWTRLKTEELLNPVMKKLNEKKQSTIKDYFKSQISKKFIDTSTLSERVKKAIEKMNGNLENENQPEEVIGKKIQKRKPPVTKQQNETVSSIKSNNGVVTLSDDEVSGDKPSTSQASPKTEDRRLLNNVKKDVLKRKVSFSENQNQGGTTDTIAIDTPSPPKNRKVRIPDTKQVIPQREKDKKEKELAKQKAVEVFKKSQQKKKKKLI